MGLNNVFSQVPAGGDSEARRQREDRPEAGPRREPHSENGPRGEPRGEDASVVVVMTISTEQPRRAELERLAERTALCFAELPSTQARTSLVSSISQSEKP